MFRTSICPSSGVQVVYCCMWCSALGVVAVVLRSRCLVFTNFQKNQISNFMNIRPVEAELFDADGKVDGQTEGQTERQT